MKAPSSVELLLKYRDQSDQRAAEEFLSRYADRLVTKVRRRMSAKLARRLDAEDVAQSAYKSFFIRIRDGRIDLEAGDKPWNLLVKIALRKLFGKIDFHTAAKRSLNKEQSLPGADSLAGMPAEVLSDPEPSHDEVLALEEECDLVLRKFEPQHRTMIELRLQGYRITEIATRTAYTTVTIRTVLRRFREEAERRLARLSG